VTAGWKVFLLASDSKAPLCDPITVK